MPNWLWLLCDEDSNGRAELSTGQGRSITYARNGTPEAKVTISHDDDAATDLFTVLQNGIPKLRCYRDGVLRFHGDLAPLDEQLEEAAQLNLTFRGPFSRLQGYGQSRGRFTDSSETFTGTDAGQIAKGLIDLATDSGIATDGTIQATKTRDRSYQYANIGQAVVDLTEVLDGFDFEVEPIEYDGGDIGRFVVYARQGSDRSNTVKFQYGPGTLANVRAVSRQIEPPINVARVLGAGGLTGLKQDAASITKYGTWMVQESTSDVSEQDTLDDKAQALLRPDPIRVVTFSPDPTLAPRPWDDFWIGDTVSFYGRRGAFEEDVTVRVNKITVTLDDDGLESSEIEVEVGAGDAGPRGRATVRGVISELSRRVSRIERSI